RFTVFPFHSCPLHYRSSFRNVRRPLLEASIYEVPYFCQCHVIPAQTGDFPGWMPDIRRADKLLSSEGLRDMPRFKLHNPLNRAIEAMTLNLHRLHK
ncbi:MAG: hypothetical protein JSW24_05510, partial [Dehalococcoidia bacterium]